VILGPGNPPDLEPGALLVALASDCLDGPAVGLDHVLDDHEAEPGSVPTRRLADPEDVLAFVGRDAGAVVDDLDGLARSLPVGCLRQVLD